MIYNNKQTIKKLITLTTSHISYAEELLKISEEKLQYKPTHNSWSVLECLEHLNRYAIFTIKKLTNRYIHLHFLLLRLLKVVI